MAETIKGINVVIGSDTTGLSAALADVNKSSREIQSELSKVEKLLKFDPKNTELLAQKQKLLSDQIAITREKLDRLKIAQEQVNEQFQKGKISESQYRAFQREIIETENKLKSFEKQLKATQDRSKEFADRMGALSTKLKSVGDAFKPVSMAAGALAGGLLALGVNAGKTADDLNTMAKVTGLSTDTLQKFKYASDLIDVSMETLTGSLARLTRNMGQAQNGNKQVQEAFDRLGVSIYGANGNLRDNEEVFNDVITALGNVSSETERDAIAMQLFGRSAQDLNPLILGGADALKQLGDEAEKAGLIMSQKALDDINQFNDEIDKLKATTNATFLQLGATIGKAFLPILQGLAERLKGVMEWLRGLDERTLKIIVTISALVAAIAPALLVLAKITTTIKTLTPVFTGLSKAIAGISLSTIGTVAAIAAFAAIAIEVYRNWQQVKTALLAIWDLIKASATQLSLNIAIAFEKMKNAVLNAISGILERLSVLEKLPFGIGEKFAGLKDAISNSAEQSAEKINLLEQAAEENKKRIQEATEGTKIAFSDLGQAIANDVKGVINALTGQSNAIQKQTDTITNEKNKQVNMLKQKGDEALQYEAQWQQRLQELNDQYKLSRVQSLEEETKLRLEILERQKQEELKKAEELGASTKDILAYYALEEQMILEKKNEALAQSYDWLAGILQNFILSVRQGTKNFKDAIKEMIVSIISYLQQMIVAAVFTAEAIAYAMSLGTFGASLKHLATLATKVIPKIAALEAIKQGISALAEGALVTGPTLALVGEGRNNEAVLPLSQRTYDQLGKSIAAHIPQQNGGQGLTVNINVHGNIIGDKQSMKKLAQEVFSYEYAIKRRLGGAEA